MNNLTFLLLILSQGFITYGQSKVSTEKMSLESVVQFALENSPMLKSQNLERLSNEYQINSIKAQGLPQVSGKGSYSYNYALAQQILPGEIFGQPGESVSVSFGVANSLSSSIEISQLLYSKSYQTGLKAAKASIDLTELSIFQAKEDLIYDVITAYLQLNLIEKNQSLLQSNIERVTQLKGLAKLQYEEGLIKKIDVDQLTVNETNIKSELRNLQTTYGRQLNLLKFYMGLSPSENISLMPYEVDENSYPLTSLNVDNNTSLRVLDKQISLSYFDLENVKAGYFPTLSAFGSYGWTGQTNKLFSSEPSNDLQGATNGVLGLNLTVPIFDGFKKKYDSQRIRVQQEQLAYSREQLLNSIEMNFDNANQTLSSNRIILDSQKENMLLAENLYEVAKLSYKEGIAPLTELLNAETSLKEAQTQYITSLLNLKIAELDHLQTSGQLSSLIRLADQ